MDHLEFNEIYKEERGAMYHGRLKLTKQGIIFKNNKNGKVDNVPSGEVDALNWLRMARGPALRIMTKAGNVYRYTGFGDVEKDKLSKFFEVNYQVTLKVRDMSVKGWNWGTANFEGNSLLFNVDGGDLAFEVPLPYVSHCTSAKNEVTMEFHQNDDAPVQLCEMRFFIPSDPNSSQDTVQSNILEKADVIQATGDALVTFRELQCLTPRGRYDIKIFQTFIQLHGKTFDYKIPLATILRLFLLPHKDGRQIFFVLSLDPPIKQGQTRYHFLILLFNQDEDPVTVTLAASESDLQKYEDKIQKEMTGPTFEVISKIMKALVQRKITIPGNFKAPDLAPSDYFLFGLLKKELKGKRFDSDEDVQKVVQDFFHTLPKSTYKEGIYKLPERWRRCIESQVHVVQAMIIMCLYGTTGDVCSHTGAKCITCSYRAVNGLLYPLERGFIFVHKPPMHIRFEEISSVNFARSGGSTRSFDFEIEVKNGALYTFSSIEKEEYGKLFDFATQKNLRIKNRGGGGTTEKSSYNEELVNSDEEEGEPDAYLERMKKEGKQREEAGGGGSDSDDESDESFNPDKEGGGSDVAEEYDSNPPTSESSDEEGGGGEEKKKKKSPRHSDKGSSDGGSGDGSDEEKPKKKPKEPKKSKSAKTVKEPGMRKQRKKKKERDANKPKRPPSAYFLFLSDKREQIKRDNPGISITEITKKAGEMWKNESDKSKWDEEARIKKTEYAKAMADYLASGGGIKQEKDSGDEEDTKKKRSVKKKKESSPKKRAEGEDSAFKSKEYISSSASLSSSDEDSKPLKVKSEQMEVDSPPASDQNMSEDD
ncbi:SSRP1 [Cordylochernes scorpioides]|uniref:SSRP1 n=1 Tax=Cordylochernes scorpioides TaxID=51811 RepID=A0ABY6KYH8_9ARAC|nr:SSRP1 [Cordylochernes scorpioides]